MIRRWLLWACLTLGASSYAHALGGSGYDALGLTSLTAGKGMSVTGSGGSKTVAMVVSTYGVTAAGTAYSVTATTATLDFGTTDPTVSLAEAGTFLIVARVHLLYNSATFAANRTVTLKLRRTNNTAADIVTTALTTRIITTITDDFGTAELPPVIYTTTNTNDALDLAGLISVVPTAGNLQATEAEILVIRLF